MMDDLIKEDDYVIVQRHNYRKYHKLSSKNKDCKLGKDTVDLSAVIGHPYWTTFKVEPKERRKNVFMLAKCDSVVYLSDEILKNISSGSDNRDILDDGSSQKLSTEEIIGLKESGLSAQAIVGTLIENSTSFSSKTEFSQEKYIKKKEKKYFEYILILRPTLRIIAEIMIGKLPNKSLGLRMDTLSQINTIACTRSGGCYMIYETGCQGLVTASILNSIGSEGTIIHAHSGTHPEKQVLHILNLTQDRLNQVLSININQLVQSTRPANEKTVENIEVTELGKRKLLENAEGTDSKKPRREEYLQKALDLLKERHTDGLVIIGKEHPGNILKELLAFLHSSRPFVVFCSFREPLQELFLELKQRSDIAAVRLTESWLRGYQVLPERTHPNINMSGSGGFLLSGIKVSPL